MSEFQEISKHLDELRVRILRIVIVVGIITAFLLTFHLTPFEFGGMTLYYPTLEPLDNIAAQITNYMKEQLVPEQVQLIQTAPAERQTHTERDTKTMRETYTQREANTLREKHRH